MRAVSCEAGQALLENPLSTTPVKAWVSIVSSRKRGSNYFGSKANRENLLNASYEVKN